MNTASRGLCVSLTATAGLAIWLAIFSPEIGNGPISATVQAEEVHSKWTKAEIPLTVYRHENWGYVSAEGFWQATNQTKDKQLIFPIAVKIRCDRNEKICREADAAVQFGILKSDLLEYEISSWSDAGIVADDSDEGECGIAHRLSVDFKSNSITITDYPKKVSNTEQCKGFQDANSYALHGGQLMLYPPAPWDPLAKRETTQ
jgi:hypothetical protein